MGCLPSTEIIRSIESCFHQMMPGQFPLCRPISKHWWKHTRISSTVQSKFHISSAHI